MTRMALSYLHIVEAMMIYFPFKATNSSMLVRLTLGIFPEYMSNSGSYAQRIVYELV